MNRRAKLLKRGERKAIEQSPENDKMGLSDETRAALLTRLEAIERNVTGTQKQIERLREDIAKG